MILSFFSFIVLFSSYLLFFPLLFSLLSLSRSSSLDFLSLFLCNARFLGIGKNPQWSQIGHLFFFYNLIFFPFIDFIRFSQIGELLHLTTGIISEDPCVHKWEQNWLKVYFKRKLSRILQSLPASLSNSNELNQKETNEFWSISFSAPKLFKHLLKKGNEVGLVHFPLKPAVCSQCEHWNVISLATFWLGAKL